MLDKKKCFLENSSNIALKVLKDVKHRVIPIYIFNMETNLLSWYHITKKGKWKKKKLEQDVLLPTAPPS